MQEISQAPHECVQRTDLGQCEYFREKEISFKRRIPTHAVYILEYQDCLQDYSRNNIYPDSVWCRYASFK